MGFTELGSLIAIAGGIVTILAKVGNVYDEIRITKFKVEAVDKSIVELKALDGNLDGRISAIENFLVKTTDFVVR